MPDWKSTLAKVGTVVAIDIARALARAVLAMLASKNAIDTPQKLPEDTGATQ